MAVIRLTLVLGLLMLRCLASLGAEPSLSSPRPIALSAEQIEAAAQITGGDLLLFTPRKLAGLRPGTPLIAFTPVDAADELRVSVAVQAEDYYQLQVNQVSGPNRGSYVLSVDDCRIPERIGLRWPELRVRLRHWAQFRLKPGCHLLRFRTGRGSPVFPLAVADLTLKPGSLCSVFAEAEKLPVVARDREKLLPRLGSRHLSGYGELRFAAERPGDSLTLELPPAPDETTHLVVALVGGPDRGIGQLALNGRSPTRPIDTYSPQTGRVTTLVTLPIAAGMKPPQRLRLVCTGRREDSTGYAIGLDGVAFGVDRVLEAEWLVWKDAWGPHRILYGTRSGRVSDRGYIAADCRDANVPLEATFHLPWTGDFEFQVRAAKSSDHGKVQYEFDGHRFPQVIDDHAPKRDWPAEWTALGRIALKPGRHTFRVWSRDAKSERRRVRDDAIRFVPQERQRSSPGQPAN